MSREADRALFEQTYDELRRVLGDLLLSANQLEDVMVDLMWIGGQQDRRDVLVAVRGETTGSLFERHLVPLFDADGVLPGDFVDRWERLKTVARVAIVRRNEFVHASWAVAHDGSYVQRDRRLRPADRRRRAEPPLEEMARLTLDQVEAAVAEIDDATMQLYDFYDDVQEALSSNPPQTQLSGDLVTRRP